MKTYKITSLHHVYIDNFNEGETENVNNYDISQEIKAENLKEAIKKYVDEVLCYSFKFKYANIDEDQKCIHYSNLVDNDNIEILPNEQKYKDWQKNKLELYANNYTIYAEELKEVFLKN
ncbi:hypothetical protein [Polaribacter sp.]|uniref:hypothetical protein n=1 Tax=Polaribacter sp. TaxID=1920175 RepID=UPI003F6CD714